MFDLYPTWTPAALSKVNVSTRAGWSFSLKSVTGLATTTALTFRSRPAQSVEAGDNTSPQVRLDHLFVQSIVGLMPAVETFDRWFQAEASFPFVPANRRVSCPALPVLPSLGVHILPSLEQRHEQPDLLRRIELGRDSRLWFYL
jgi:hypothetical protein